LSQFRDPPALWVYQSELAAGVPAEAALTTAALHSRDRCRTPMQWEPGPNAGFSPPGVQTWLPVNPDWAPAPHGRGVSVLAQDADSGSLLNFYRQLLRFRRQTPALLDGDYQPLNEAAPDYLAFRRQSASTGQACLVVLNYSAAPVTADLTSAGRTARCLFSTSPQPAAEQDLSEFTSAPFGLYIGALEG
jgi:alpha-glucosidase